MKICLLYRGSLISGFTIAGLHCIKNFAAHRVIVFSEYLLLLDQYLRPFYTTI